MPLIVLNLSLIQFLYATDNLQKFREQKKILDCTNKMQSSESSLWETYRLNGSGSSTEMYKENERDKGRTY